MKHVSINLTNTSEQDNRSIIINQGCEGPKKKISTLISTSAVTVSKHILVI